ncbi:MAG: hypothetical protein U0V04_03915 [Spirosomataceae bacterium]
MKIKSYPSILYFGTPVVLISSKNPNNSTTWLRHLPFFGWGGDV